MPITDPIERAIYMKEYFKKNKEKFAIYDKKYREKNKGKIEAYRQTPAFKKSNRISNWKSQGIHVEDMEILYKWFLEATHCESCNLKFIGGKRNNLTKCIDHDHNLEFNNFRAILCNSCNTNQKDNNTSGIPNISLEKNGSWRYRRMINKKKHCKYFKTKQEAIEYKKAYETTRIYSHQ